MGLERFKILFVFFAITLLYISTNQIKLFFPKKLIIILFIWCIASLPPEFKFVSPIIEALRFFPLLVLFNDKENMENHLKFISVSLAIILVPGIILWIMIHMLDFPFIGVPVQMGDIDNNNYYFYNYFVLLDRIVVESTRFQSIFLEPGYLGTMIAFLLYALKYQWHSWYIWILLLGLVLSQSLAGYITFVVGYLLYKSQSGKSIKTFIVPLTFIISFIVGMQIYNDGDNFFNTNIVQRLINVDSGKYIFSESIRNDEFANIEFKHSLQSGTFILGDSDKLNISGAGYKIFLIQKGLVAAILYFLVYIIITKYSYDNKYGNHFVILVVLTFLQAAYPSSYSWMLPFVMGILSCNNEHVENENIVY